MPLDIRIRLLDWLLKQRKPLTAMTLAELKQYQNTEVHAFLAWLFLGQPPQMARIVNQTIAGRHGEIPIRLYYPTLARTLPLLIFFHGGGWVTGNLQTHDVICRRLAQDNQVLVLAVDYRLAPFHKFPIPLQDCYDATLWAASQVETLNVSDQSLILMGDSAGGNLATAVCQLIRDTTGPKICRQVLIYPAVDGTLSFPSHQLYAEAPLLRAESIHFFRDQYARTEADFKDPYFSPYWADDLSHLPPALIITAEYDPLRHEAEAYAKRLQAANVPVQLTNYAGMMHGFPSFPRFCPQATDALFAEIATYIGEAIAETTVSDLSQ